MKALFLLAGLTMLTCSSQKSNLVTTMDTSLSKQNIEVVSQNGKTILNGIQKKIETASYNGFANRNTQELDKIETSLENEKTSNKNLTDYWIAYINYYKTIINSKVLRDNNTAKKCCDKGIEKIEHNSPLNSNDYALLILLKSLSYSWENPIALNNEIKTAYRKCRRTGAD